MAAVDRAGVAYPPLDKNRAIFLHLCLLQCIAERSIGEAEAEGEEHLVLLYIAVRPSLHGVVGEGWQIGACLVERDGKNSRRAVAAEEQICNRPSSRLSWIPTLDECLHIGIGFDLGIEGATAEQQHDDRLAG
ncbi:hypothetical protein SDC9_180169 [bioreactor metagenome]|uniref:Uncharacterized protein n=1 Tax=bioreactor metagenome TaxID=1076179 RepID=A0A645H3W9_9ZZZZ